MAKTLAQKRASLQEEQAKARAVERAEYVARLSAAARAVERAGLLDLVGRHERGTPRDQEADPLLGALVSRVLPTQKEGLPAAFSKDFWTGMIEQWERVGRELRERELSQKREPLVIIFREVPPKGSATHGALQEAGFKRAGLPGWFRGDAHLEAAQAIVRGPYAGTVHRVGPDNALVPVGWDAVPTESEEVLPVAAE